MGKAPLILSGARKGVVEGSGPKLCFGHFFYTLFSPIKLSLPLAISPLSGAVLPC
jgi:hypothetical protein